jgi:hypothetical protein
MIEKMLALRLLGMVEAVNTQEQDAASRELSLLVDQQWNWRENQALGRRLKAQSCATMPASKRSTIERPEVWIRP